MTTTFADKALKYFLHLRAPRRLPQKIEIINPYENKEVQLVVKKFYRKYFNDNHKRRYIFGINPGRFGGGLTGISFNDPVALREYCGIENKLGNSALRIGGSATGGKRELSSKFIYRMIEEYGGVEKFYSKNFLSALFPFALLSALKTGGSASGGKDGKNCNYYDTVGLSEGLRNEIVKSVKAQIEFGAKRDSVIILGKKNAQYFSELNDEHHFFEEIITLEHPRYIMQYRLKKIDYYISKYLDYID